MHQIIEISDSLCVTEISKMLVFHMTLECFYGFGPVEFDKRNIVQK